MGVVAAAAVARPVASGVSARAAAPTEARAAMAAESTAVEAAAAAAVGWRDPPAARMAGGKWLRSARCDR